MEWKQLNCLQRQFDDEKQYPTTMSAHSRSTSVLSIGTYLEPQPVDPYSHPLSPDLNDPSLKTFFTNPNTETHLDSWNPKRRPASIRSELPIRHHGTKIKHHPMRRSNSSSASKPPYLNHRNLIFDEWITSTAHPVLAAHSLIPTEIVDDDKAVRDMLAEAMSDETFVSVSMKGGEEDVVRPLRPMSAIDIPVKNADVETRPRSSSSLSLRKWAGIFVGKGESGRRPALSSTARPKLTQKRSFSAPDTASTHESVSEDATLDKGNCSSNFSNCRY